MYLIGKVAIIPAIDAQGQDVEIQLQGLRGEWRMRDLFILHRQLAQPLSEYGYTMTSDVGIFKDDVVLGAYDVEVVLSPICTRVFNVAMHNRQSTSRSTFKDAV